MIWIKHYTNSTNDDKINKLEEAFGIHMGYSLFWRFVELCGVTYKGKSKPVFYFHERILRSQLHLKHTKLLLFISTCTLSNMFLATRTDNVYKIDFPNLLKIKDNHTSSLQVTDKQLVPRVEEGNSGKSKEKNYIKKSDFDFESVYKNFPLKLGKSIGLKKCKKEVKNQKDYDDLCKSVSRYREKCSGKEKQFILKFSNFMNEWRDYLDDDVGSCDVEQPGDCDSIEAIKEMVKDVD